MKSNKKIQSHLNATQMLPLKLLPHSIVYFDGNSPGLSHQTAAARLALMVALLPHRIKSFKTVFWTLASALIFCSQQRMHIQLKTMASNFNRVELILLCSFKLSVKMAENKRKTLFSGCADPLLWIYKKSYENHLPYPC